MTFRTTLWLAAAALVFAAPLHACVTDLECDDGDACTLADTCQSGACGAGGGGDSDADGTCDADDSSDRPLDLVKLLLKMNAPSPGQTTAKVNGYFPVAAGDAFDGFAGATFEIGDTNGFVGSVTFPASGCKQVASAVRCKTADARPSKAFFKPLAPAGAVVLFKLKLVNLGPGGPFHEPINGRLRQTGSVVDRTGSIIDCAMLVHGLKCRQF